MEFITLSNGVKMPALGYGTFTMSNEETERCVLEAIKTGYRLIDTAQMYGNEKEVGQGILNSGINRNELFITTKIYRISNSYEKAKIAIEESLKNLQLDYIDLLLLHEPYSQGPQMYHALEEAYFSGKVKAIGISNYDENWYQTFIRNCKVIPAVNQVENHIYYQKWKLHELLTKNGTAMQAWSPLAQGMIKLSDQDVLKKIGKKYNKTPAQIVLRFLTQRRISVIPKSKHEIRLIENIDIFDFKLDDEEIKQIRQLDKNDTLFTWTKRF